MGRIRARLMGVVFVGAVGLWLRVADGREITYPSDMAADRVLGNIESWIKGHPEDGAGNRVLGRVHGLAWAYGEQIPMWNPGGPGALPDFSEFTSVLVSRTGPAEDRYVGVALVKSPERGERAITAADAGHLAASIAAYQQAIKLDPKDALSELGLGAMLAQQGLYARQLPASYFADGKPSDADGVAWKRAIGQLSDGDPHVRDAASKALLAAMPRDVGVLREAKTDDPEVNGRIDGVLRSYFELEALEHYRKAFDLRSKEDLKGEPTFQADSQISARAGGQILLILAAHPQAARKDEVKSMQGVLEPLLRKRGGLSERG